MKKKMWSSRIANLPPYLFAELDRIKGELVQKGVDIIDLSIGDPDLPTPRGIIEALEKAAHDAKNHRYPAYNGSLRFRRAVANWYMDRFNVSLDPETEVLALIGSKEGIAHAPLAFIDSGDIALTPDPGYPVYQTATKFAGGEPHTVPLLEENNFRPRLEDISKDIARKSKLLFLNYPNNPTSATCDIGFFERVSDFAKQNEILICHDAAYSEVTFRGHESCSFMELKDAKSTAIEFHSLSKTFNMTGWRIGFVVGHPEAIAGLSKIKNNVDSGVFTAIQEAGIFALENWKVFRDANNEIYEHRRDMVVERVKKLGIHYFNPKATFYVWCRVPGKEASAEFCGRVLRETGVTLTPGVGFGRHGEGYFRISLTASEVRLQEAFRRLEGVL